jgi:hypothetical protein
MPRGGHPRQVSINGREYDPAPDSSVTIILSGWTNENLATGNGGIHTNQNRKLGGFDGLTLSISGAESDYEAMQAVANGEELVPVNITLANGDTYSGSLQIEGDLNFNGGDGTVELAMRGPIFEKL